VTYRGRWVAGLLVLLLFGCRQEPEPLKIGFVGGLSGRVADLGIAGRDGVMLAVEQLNEQGGINGRKVRLLVRDDGQDAGKAVRAVDDLLAQHVEAIIGPMTSQMGIAVAPEVSRAGITAISPTVKTDLLSRQDDYFFRVTPELGENARILSRYLLEERRIRRMVLVFDTLNGAFTESWVKRFSETYRDNGGEVVAALPFTSDNRLSFLELSRRITVADAGGVLILASALDTAMICQQLEKLGSHLPLFSSEWSFTTDLISYGGKTVEGLISFHSFNVDSSRPSYLAFRKRFQDRYANSPSFANTLAYDAAQVLFEALRQRTAGEDLRHTILTIGKFPGLQSEISFNRFGDVRRRLFCTKVKNGRFVVQP